MPNARDLRPDATTSILVAPPKGGKTYAIKTWPRPAWVASFDGGVAPLAGEDIDYDIFYDANRYKPTAYTDFEKRFDEVVASKKYKSIILDNLTFLSKHILNYIQYTNRTIDKPAGYEGYRMLLNKMSDVIVKARAAGCHLLVTAEEKTEKDEITGDIQTLPSIEGSYRDFIVAEFDFALYGRVGRDPKDPRKPRYYWQTVPDHRIKCAGARWDCGLDVEETPDFKVILRKIEARFPHVTAQVAR